MQRFSARKTTLGQTTRDLFPHILASPNKQVFFQPTAEAIVVLKIINPTNKEFAADGSKD
jgi:hypothetical protein